MVLMLDPIALYLMVRQLEFCMVAEGASDALVFLSSAEPAVMVKAMMLMYPRTFKGLSLQQRPVSPRAASSRPKLKQKLAKHKEMTHNRGKLQECGKLFHDTRLACLLFGRKKKRKQKARICLFPP